MAKFLQPGEDWLDFGLARKIKVRARVKFMDDACNFSGKRKVAGHREFDPGQTKYREPAFTRKAGWETSFGK